MRGLRANQIVCRERGNRNEKRRRQMSQTDDKAEYLRIKAKLTAQRAQREPRASGMSWVEAVGMFGEPALKAGHSHQRVSNWRRDGVPGAVTEGLRRGNSSVHSAPEDQLLEAVEYLIQPGTLKFGPSAKAIDIIRDLVAVIRAAKGAPND